MEAKEFEAKRRRANEIMPWLKHPDVTQHSMPVRAFEEIKMQLLFLGYGCLCPPYSDWNFFHFVLTGDGGVIPFNPGMIAEELEELFPNDL